MTDAEAQTITRIIGTADGGCSNCVGSLVEILNQKFPQFKWTMEDHDAVSLYYDTWEPVDWEHNDYERPSGRVVPVTVTAA